jgi:large subunit ribosomal protein L14e
MFEIGRVCIKTCGREAGQIAIVVDKIDDKFVLIDGNVRRKKCNVKHLEPLTKVLKVKKKAGTDEVLKAMKDAKIRVGERKRKEKKVKEKPIKKRVKKKEDKVEKKTKKIKK